MTVCDLYKCLSDDCPVDIYQDSKLLYTGHAYDIPIGLMNASVKKISVVYDARRMNMVWKLF